VKLRFAIFELIIETAFISDLYIACLTQLMGFEIAEQVRNDGERKRHALRFTLCERPHPTLSLTRERKKRQRQKQRQRHLRVAIYAFCKTPHLPAASSPARGGEARFAFALRERPHLPLRGILSRTGRGHALR
jgi:hypothetical protein